MVSLSLLLGGFADIIVCLVVPNFFVVTNVYDDVECVFAADSYIDTC